MSRAPVGSLRRARETISRDIDIDRARSSRSRETSISRGRLDLARSRSRATVSILRADGDSRRGVLAPGVATPSRRRGARTCPRWMGGHPAGCCRLGGICPHSGGGHRPPTPRWGGVGWVGGGHAFPPVYWNVNRAGPFVAGAGDRDCDRAPATGHFGRPLFRSLFGSDLGGGAGWRRGLRPRRARRGGGDRHARRQARRPPHPNFKLKRRDSESDVSGAVFVSTAAGRTRRTGSAFPHCTPGGPDP